MHLFCWIPAVFKRYYTVMCLKHLIFFFHTPSRQLFYAIQALCCASCPASGLSSLNSTPLIALSLCHCCASSQSFENYLHLAHHFVGLMAHSCNLFNFIHINVFIGYFLMVNTTGIISLSSFNDSS
jgi:hypothetical protein